MTSTVHWELQMVALSPIAHKEQMFGTTAMLRREKVFSPSGEVVEVPVVSGNSLRGVLRRVGEEMLREVLEYEGRLPLRVAHALRNGGSLTKSDTEVLSGRRLARLRELVPHVAVFGCAAGSRTVSGSIRVGKVRPVCRETAHLLPGVDAAAAPSVFTQVCLEPYSHFGDGGNLAAAEDADGPDPLMRYEIEAFATGVPLRSWLRLDNAGAGEVAFVTELLDQFRRRGHLGARSGTGFGLVALEDLPPHLVAGSEYETCDWRAQMRSRRDEVMEALTWIG